MPSLHLNGRAVEAPEGATILEAARAAGIEIPTLRCYPVLEPHTKMAALKVGAVKVTAVERKPWTSESPAV